MMAYYAGRVILTIQQVNAMRLLAMEMQTRAKAMECGHKTSSCGS